MKKLVTVLFLYMGVMGLVLWADGMRVKVNNYTDMIVQVSDKCNDCGHKVDSCDHGHYHHVAHERYCDECGNVRCKPMPIAVKLMDRCNTMHECVMVNIDKCGIESQEIMLGDKKYRISGQLMQTASFLFWGGNDYLNLVVEPIH